MSHLKKDFPQGVAHEILYDAGVSLNNLSLFGLVLVAGIVVDDAIAVVENVERYIHAGMSPPEAAHRTMDEVGGALISIALTSAPRLFPRHSCPVSRDC